MGASTHDDWDGDEENGNFDDWEDLSDSEAAEAEQTRALFSTRTMASVDEVLRAAQDECGFDVVGQSSALGLDEYGFIRLVNYVRREAGKLLAAQSAEAGAGAGAVASLTAAQVAPILAALAPPASCLLDDDLLRPQEPNDPLLQYGFELGGDSDFSDDDDDEGGEGGGGGGGGGGMGMAGMAGGALPGDGGVKVKTQVEVVSQCGKWDAGRVGDDADGMDGAAGGAGGGAGEAGEAGGAGGETKDTDGGALAAENEGLKEQVAALERRVASMTTVLEAFNGEEGKEGKEDGGDWVDNDTYYFSSYSSHHIHEEMLKDRPRTLAYRDSM